MGFLHETATKPLRFYGCQVAILDFRRQRKKTARYFSRSIRNFAIAQAVTSSDRPANDKYERSSADFDLLTAFWERFERLEEDRPEVV